MCLSCIRYFAFQFPVNCVTLENIHTFPFKGKVSWFETYPQSLQKFQFNVSNGSWDSHSLKIYSDLSWDA